jgi:hypothetical protein
VLQRTIVLVAVYPEIALRVVPPSTVRNQLRRVPDGLEEESARLIASSLAVVWPGHRVPVQSFPSGDISMATNILSAAAFAAMGGPRAVDKSAIVARDEPGGGTTYEVYRLAVYRCATVERAQALAEIETGDIVLGPEDAALVVRDRRDPDRTAFEVTFMGLGAAHGRAADGLTWIGLTTTLSGLKDAVRAFADLVGPKAPGTPKRLVGPGAAAAREVAARELASATSAGTDPRPGATRRARRQGRRR